VVGTYRRCLLATVRGSAAAYGYTLSVWTSGAALIHEHGQPSMLDIVLFLVGAVGAFALVALLALGGARELPHSLPEGALVLAGTMHVISAGAALGAAILIAIAVNGDAAWPLASFSLTGLYLTVTAGEVAFMTARYRQS
jgi:hypothetical protein